jgi:L-2-hydroxyglutarate oxidase LhgO
LSLPGKTGAFTGKPAFSRLIYPAPVHGGLGVHVTLDLAGRMRFGPDVEWLPPPVDSDAASPAAELAALAALDFRVNPARAAAFQAAVRQYWPALPDGALVPDYAGIRPKVRARACPGAVCIPGSDGHPARKLSGPGAAAADFVVAGSARHGARGLVALLGIESPGLTACLALGDAAARAVQAEDDGSGAGFT